MLSCCKLKESHMKILVFCLLAVLNHSPALAQVARQITMDIQGNSPVISFLVDESIIVNISQEGTILDFGIENNSVYNYHFKLDKYMGRVDHYSANDNEAFQGKIKYIGRTLFTYYSASENDMFRGKIKTIGTIRFSYFTGYDDEAFRGKIKEAGLLSFNWYGSIDNEAFKGKLKTVGGTPLTYYAAYDDKAYKGKIKSIGTTSYTYYSFYDRQEYRGAMKTGNRTPNINGIKYLIKY